MKAILSNELVEMADPQPESGLVLVRVQTSAQCAHTRRLSRADIWELAKRRIPLVKEAIRYDGLRLLFSKGAHMLRRETMGLDGQCASFVGEVIAAPDVAGLEIGTRVAGIALSIPAHTELVLARPEFIFPLSEKHNPDLSAAILHGGIALWAAQYASARTAGPIGVCGTGTRARLVRSALAYLEREVAATAETWIQAETTSSPYTHPTQLVIGLDVPLKTMENCWPDAGQLVPLSIADLCRDSNFTTDIFHVEGDLKLPDWHQPAVFKRYLDLVAEGRFNEDAAHLDGPDFSLANFPKKAQTSAPGILVHREPVVDCKQVSVIGAGRQAVGMAVRQLAKEPNIALRGACDRRPETLHLVSKTLPFHYTTTCHDEVFSDPMTDMIVVAPFHEKHAQFAAQALRSGKHCFVEKPPALNYAELDGLVSACRETGSFLWAGFNRRHAPATAILTKELSKTDGPLTITMVVRPPTIQSYKTWILWRSNGASRLISNLCHQIDLAAHLVTARPICVHSIPSTVGHSHRNVSVVITFEDGSLATLVFTERGRDGNHEKCEEFYSVMRGGTTAYIENFNRLNIVKNGRERLAWKGPADHGHRGLMADVAKTLVEGGPPPSPEPIFNTVRLYLAAATSLGEGRPITLGERVRSAA